MSVYFKKRRWHKTISLYSFSTFSRCHVNTHVYIDSFSQRRYSVVFLITYGMHSYQNEMIPSSCTEPRFSVVIFIYIYILNLASVHQQMIFTDQAFCQDRQGFPRSVAKRSREQTVFFISACLKDICHFTSTARSVMFLYSNRCALSAILLRLILTSGDDKAQCSTHCFGICVCVFVSDLCLRAIQHEY